MNYNTLDVHCEIKAAEITDDGVFKGYASTFGGAPDFKRDIVRPGAFTHTIKKGGRFGTGIALLSQHDMTKPIGKWLELSENARGMPVIGKLAKEIELGHDTWVLMKMGAINALSIGWDPLEIDSDGNPVAVADAIEIDNKKNIRYIKQADLWEISTVTFPANPRARITDVKAAVESAKTERELEAGLVEAGLSKKSAEYIVSLCKASLFKEINTNPFNAAINSLRALNADFLVKSMIIKAERRIEIETKMKPNEGENKEDFISRCMGSEEMNAEFEDNTQRYAVCESSWERHGK